MDELVATGNEQGETIAGPEDAMQTDEFSQSLTRCDPAGELTARERELLAVMLKESMPRRKRHHIGPIGAATVAALVLGGVGVAAAASGIWEPWAGRDPYVAVRFQAPSGAQCEMRVGNLQGASPEVNDAIRSALLNAKFTDQDVIDGAKRVGDPQNPLADDAAYEIGLNWAITTRAEEALAAHGLRWDGATLSGQAICS